MTVRKKTIDITILTIAFFMIACSKDKDPSAKDHLINLLTEDVWVTEQVLNSADGDVTGQYKDFTIVFLKNPNSGFVGDYYTDHGSYAFAEIAGKWRFDDVMERLILSDGKEIEFKLTNKSLTLEFNVASTNGRVRGLSGNFVFILKHRI